ncbi:DUF773 domain-containing protein [Leptospira barantonii]|uniref:DUF773 domain-containing protein n=1 Tax=Leptospira barantonii TaxID=2023184 RepID=A0ABX4NTM5_9LEPT|nr:DUF773 domain-containing protein [Leptospira barantonii]PJZ59211.1 DUF773 domain-containing protein [Leptospira barantonii]
MSLFLFETFSDNFQTKHKEVASGKWFGLNTLNLDGKPFAAFFEGELVLKLGAEKIAEILDRYPGAKLFDPSRNNRAMKDWLQIPVEFQEDWDSLGESALILAQKAAKAGTPAKKKAAPKKAAKKKVAAKKKSAPKKKAAKPKKASAKKAKAKVKPKKKVAAKKKVAKKKTAAKKKRR